MEEKYYVAYHNTEGMGRRLPDGDPCRVFTNKSVASMLDGVVWVVIGEGTNPRQFSLGSIFKVTKTGDAKAEGFEHFISGNGQAFDPPIPLNDLEWFPDLKTAVSRFQFGVQRLKDEQQVENLINLSRTNGALVP